ncbi:DoxX family protein [Candidatus Parcubacteria bacterium]|nr:DoxX family protein [Candidatus Parcubacteria bacterium]
MITKWSYHRGWALLFVRLAAGLIFLTHGWQKLMNLRGAESFFNTLGLPPGTAVFIAVVETVGGVMLALGVAPRLAGLILGIEMLVALLLVSIPSGHYELELLLAAAAFAVFFAGSNTYALYSLEHKND